MRMHDAAACCRCTARSGARVSAVVARDRLTLSLKIRPGKEQGAIIMKSQLSGTALPAHRCPALLSRPRPQSLTTIRHRTTHQTIRPVSAHLSPQARPVREPARESRRARPARPARAPPARARNPTTTCPMKTLGGPVARGWGGAGGAGRGRPWASCRCAGVHSCLCDCSLMRGGHRAEALRGRRTQVLAPAAPGRKNPIRAGKYKLRYLAPLHATWCITGITYSKHSPCSVRVAPSLHPLHLARESFHTVGKKRSLCF